MADFLSSVYENFVDNYLAVESTTFGAAGIDSKADIQRIEPKDYVPNALQTEKVVDRLYSYWGTNKKIVQSSYTEDEWTAYYESEIEPVVVQMYQTYTVALFSRKERGYGNRIVFEANNLQCASLTTKLAFQAMVEVVNMLEDCLNKMNGENYMQITSLMGQILKTCGGGENGET